MSRDNEAKKQRTGSFYRSEMVPPRGSNSLNSLGLFDQRKYYRDFIYPRYTASPLDLWYDRKYFGKINTKGDAIFAQTHFLKAPMTSTKNIFALDFVVDAFNEFRNRFLFGNRQNVSGTPFENLNASRGWVSVELEYEQYMENVYERFANLYMSQNKRDQKLITFESFMKLFLEFVDMNAPHFPITLSQYIYSPLCPPTISGLMLEVSLDAHGDDFRKYDNFINHDMYGCYVKMAQEHGFKIDKNAPQRLIADINSPAMMKYLSVYPKPPKEFNKIKPVMKAPDPPKKPENPNPDSVVPWTVGDPITFLMLHKDSNWTILKNYSDLADRVLPAGTRSKESPEHRSGASPGASELESLLKRFRPGSKLTSVLKDITYKGIVHKVSPTLQERAELRLIPSYNMADYHQELARRNMGQKINNIVIVELTRWVPPNRSLGQTITGASYDIETAPWTDGKSYGYYQKGVEEYHRFYMEVPMDSLHLSADAAELTKKRFNDMISYTKRIKKWSRENAEYVAMWNNFTKPKLEEDIKKYEIELKEYKKSFEYWNTAPRLAGRNVIERRCSSAYQSDMFILKEMCLRFYNSYARAKPRTTISEVIRCGNNIFKTKTRAIKREQINRVAIAKKYPDLYWIEQYITFRNAELGRPKSLKRLKAITKESLSIKSQHNLKKALSFINDQFKFKVDNS